MKRLIPSGRRARIALVLLVLTALVVFLPLRLAIGLSGLDRRGLSASHAGGPVWSGYLLDARMGDLMLGGVHMDLSPWPLFVGRMRWDIYRTQNQPDDIRGAVTIGFNQRGVDDLKGRFAARSLFAPLPVDSIEFADVTVHFAGQTCSHAEGGLRLRLLGPFSGLNLSQGLYGQAKCDGQAVLFPLMSQSGMEKLMLRITRDGQMTAQASIGTGNGIDPALLSASGFRQNGDSWVLNIDRPL